MLAVACALALSAGRADDWLVLFNGTDLTGWKANREQGSFTVADGVLRVQAVGKGSAHLFFVGGRADGVESFTNFELEATCKADPQSNGGIFVHTDMTTRDNAYHLHKGYEVQLNSTPRERRKTGSLYAVVDRDVSPVDETNWFVVKVVVDGKRITVALDGKQVVDYTEPADVTRPKERAGRRFGTAGGLALQAHDPKSVWYFKDVRVKRRS